MQSRTMILTVALLTSMLAAGGALAQQAERFGDFSIHYNAINTNLLDPDTARAYDIQRSGTRALLNIAVLRAGEDGDVPVTARVSVTAVNLVGQRRDIEMREIRDQDAIYYIGTFRFRQEESLNFRISVNPEDNPRGPHEFTFRQQFYTD